MNIPKAIIMLIPSLVHKKFINSAKNADTSYLTRAF